MVHYRKQGVSLPSALAFEIAVAVVGTVEAAWSWWKTIAGASILVSVMTTFQAISLIETGS